MKVNQMKTYSRIRYMYLRDNKGYPHTCIVVQLDRDLDLINFQFSTLSSKENKNFIKSGARYIACQRLSKNPIHIETNLENATSHDITSQIMNVLAHGGPCVVPSKSVTAPQRVIDGGRRWLRDNVDNRPTLRRIEVAKAVDVEGTFERINAAIETSDAAVVDSQWTAFAHG